MSPSSTVSIAYFYRSSIGKKVIMAVSGLALFGFVVGHLAGNLQIFLGQDALNQYAAALRRFPAFLWAARIGLLGMAALHVWAAVSLTLENRAARPVPYHKKEFVAATYASRTMHLSGLIVLAFIVYHLLHLTWGVAHPAHFHLVDAQGRHDVYSTVVLGFQQPLIAAAYLVSVFLLSFHLSHGLSSMFQSLGINNERTRPLLGALGRAISWAIFIGYAAIPVAVLLGVVKLPPGVQP